MLFAGFADNTLPPDDPCADPTGPYYDPAVCSVIAANSVPTAPDLGTFPPDYVGSGTAPSPAPTAQPSTWWKWALGVGVVGLAIGGAVYYKHHHAHAA